MASYTKSARAFAEQTGPASNGNMIATNNEVWSYRERIARRTDEGIEVNTTKYSKTTSAHQSAVIDEIEAEGYRPAESQPDHLPEGWSLYTK